MPPYCGKAVELGPRENVTNRSSEVDNVYTFSSDEEEAGAVNDVPAATEEEMAMFLEADADHRQALQERIDELESTNLAALRKVREAEEEAKRVARELSAATGLQMRLGTLNRNGQTLKVVLAGPFTAGADQALQRIRAAGFSRARLSK